MRGPASTHQIHKLKIVAAFDDFDCVIAVYLAEEFADRRGSHWSWWIICAGGIVGGRRRRRLVCSRRWRGGALQSNSKIIRN